MNRHLNAMVAVIALASLMPALTVNPMPEASPAGGSLTHDAQPSAVESGDALAAATTVDQAEAALRTILTGGGITVDGGTGTSPDRPKATIPEWEVETLANAQIAGSSITVAENAKIFDTFSRWAGGPTVSAATFSEFLSKWIANPADDSEGYLLGALAELGKQTVPAYDLTQGAGSDAPLPLLLLIEEQIDLSALDAGLSAATTSTTVTQPQGIRLTSATGALCDDVSTSMSLKDFPAKIWNTLLQTSENWPKAGAAAKELAAAAQEIAEEGGTAAEAGSGIGDLIGVITGILQNAMAQGYLDVDVVQKPRPVDKHEQGSPPNETDATVTVKGAKDIPKDFASCMQLLGGLGVSLSQPGKPISDATVIVSAGANFPRHLIWAPGSPPAERSTDATGQVRVAMLTKPQHLPRGQGTKKTREAMLHIVVGTQHYGPGISPIVATLMEKVEPWSNDYGIEVTQREKPALSIKGNFDMNVVLLDVQGTLDLHSCDGFEGGWNGTLDIGGGFQGEYGQVATALTGLPATGSGSYQLGGVIKFHPGAVPDDPGTPVLGVANSLGGKIAIKFVDEDTAELIINGTPIINVTTGKIVQFPVTQGSDQCK